MILRVIGARRKTGAASVRNTAPTRIETRNEDRDALVILSVSDLYRLDAAVTDLEYWLNE